MAVLSSNNRALLVQIFGSDMSSTRTGVPITKAEVRAAIDAIDQWAEDNASTMNTAIPQPARGALTAKQKAQLFSYVVLKRYEVI